MNAITPPAVKPGKIWYWLGALSILAGLVVGGILIVNSISTLSKTVDGFGRVRVPGGESCKLVFDKPGRYTIYYEFETKIPQRDDACNDTGGTELINASTSSPLGLDVTLKSVDQPESAPLKTVPSTSGDVSISLNGHSGKAIREVQIDRPGDYVIEVSGGSAGTTTEPYVLAVGRGAIASVASRIVSAARDSRAWRFARLDPVDRHRIEAPQAPAASGHPGSDGLPRRANGTVRLACASPVGRYPRASGAVGWNGPGLAAASPSGPRLNAASASAARAVGPTELVAKPARASTSEKGWPEVAKRQAQSEVRTRLLHSPPRSTDGEEPSRPCRRSTLPAGRTSWVTTAGWRAPARWRRLDAGTSSRSLRHRGCRPR